MVCIYKRTFYWLRKFGEESILAKWSAVEISILVERFLGALGKTRREVARVYRFVVSRNSSSCLREKTHTILTPFSRENIKAGNDLVCLLELFKCDFRPLIRRESNKLSERDFRLCRLVHANYIHFKPRSWPNKLSAQSCIVAGLLRQNLYKESRSRARENCGEDDLISHLRR